jgi:hypothetical protein
MKGANRIHRMKLKAKMDEISDNKVIRYRILRLQKAASRKNINIIEDPRIN